QRPRADVVGDGGREPWRIGAAAEQDPVPAAVPVAVHERIARLVGACPRGVGVRLFEREAARARRAPAAVGRVVADGAERRRGDALPATKRCRGRVRRLLSATAVVWLLGGMPPAATSASAARTPTGGPAPITVPMAAGHDVAHDLSAPLRSLAANRARQHAARA